MTHWDEKTFVEKFLDLRALSVVDILRKHGYNFEAYITEKAIEELTPRKERGSKRGLPPMFEGGGEAGRVIKIESMALADEPCPDCGSNHHRSC